MMEILLKQNDTDKEMIEIITEDRGKKYVWAVIHNDILYSLDKIFYEAVRRGGIVKAELKLKEEESN
jgi:hypothetical protein